MCGHLKPLDVPVAVFVVYDIGHCELTDLTRKNRENHKISAVL